MEVNSNFRHTFKERCAEENPNIAHYEVLGLDELETWTTMQPQLRHLWFPTIFGAPRYELGIRLSVQEIVTMPAVGGLRAGAQRASVFRVEVLNTGVTTSYIDRIRFKTILNGRSEELGVENPLADKLLNRINSRIGTPLEPGRKHIFNYRIPEMWAALRELGGEAFPAEVLVYDEIGNVYSEIIPDVSRRLLQHHIGIGVAGRE